MMGPILPEAACPIVMRTGCNRENLSGGLQGAASLEEEAETASTSGISEEVRLAKQNLLLDLSSSHHRRRCRNARRGRRRRQRHEAAAAATKVIVATASDRSLNAITTANTNQNVTNNDNIESGNEHNQEICGDREYPRSSFENDEDENCSYESSCSSSYYLQSSNDEFSFATASSFSSDEEESNCPVHRIQRNLGKKRASWRQAALRERRDASTLAAIKDAARRARLLEMSHGDGNTAADEINTTTTAFLLRQVAPKRAASAPTPATPVVASRLATTSTATEEAAVIRIQTIYRGYSWRKSYNLLVPKVMHQTLAPRKHLRAMGPPSHRHVDRTTSEITMSEFEDSLHNESLQTSLSNDSFGDLHDSGHNHYGTASFQLRKLRGRMAGYQQHQRPHGSEADSFVTTGDTGDDDDGFFAPPPPLATIPSEGYSTVSSQAVGVDAPPRLSDSVRCRTTGRLLQPQHPAAAARTAWAYKSVSSFFGDSPARLPERRPSGCMPLLKNGPLILSPEQKPKGVVATLGEDDASSLVLSPEPVRETGVLSPPQEDPLNESLVFANLAHSSSRWDDIFPEPEEAADASWSHSSSGSSQEKPTTSGAAGPVGRHSVRGSLPIPPPIRKPSPMIAESSRKSIQHNRPENSSNNSNKEDSPKLPLRTVSHHMPATTAHQIPEMTTTRKSSMANISISSESSLESFSSPPLHLAPTMTSTVMATTTTTASSNHPLHRSLSLTQRISNTSSVQVARPYYEDFASDDDEEFEGECRATSFPAFQRSLVYRSRPTNRPVVRDVNEGSPQMPKRRLSKTIQLPMDDSLHSCDECPGIPAPPLDKPVGGTPVLPPPPPPATDESDDDEQSHSFNTQYAGSHAEDHSELSSLTSMSSITTTSPLFRRKLRTHTNRASGHEPNRRGPAPSSSDGAGTCSQKTCIDAGRLALASAEASSRIDRQKTKDAARATAGGCDPPVAPPTLPPKSPASGSRKHADSQPQIRRKKRPQPRKQQQGTLQTTKTETEAALAAPVSSCTKAGEEASPSTSDNTDFSSPRSVADDVVTSRAEMAQQQRMNYLHQQTATSRKPS